MQYRRGRYSWVLRPILMVYDLFIINLLAYILLDFNQDPLFFFSYDFLNNKHFLYLLYSIIFWLVSAYFLKFYEVYRFTSALEIFLLLIKQFVVYGIGLFAFEGAFRSIDINAFHNLKYLLIVFIFISFLKICTYYLLKTFRVYLRGNLRDVIIIGSGEEITALKNLFLSKQDLGYKLKGIYSNNKKALVTGNIEQSFKLLESSENIDEIYCSIDELSESDVNKYVKHAYLRNCNIKFVPKTNKILTKRLKASFYEYTPVLSFQSVALNKDFNKFIKRSFDILLSLIIIVFILSWLSVILFVIIKIESKGPLFYKHKRNGLNYKEFNCYKYRSLTTTKEIKGTYVKEDDQRLTKIGRLMRITSIDELPQFFNVLKGDMSVVGPRPHMPSYTEDYSKKINKFNFIFRHNVKPGITGLAQVKGYRGEIKTDTDIINRIKYDIFYIENWSLLLDIKIILKTIYNIIVGEEKAY